MATNAASECTISDACILHAPKILEQATLSRKKKTVPWNTTVWYSADQENDWTKAFKLDQHKFRFLRMALDRWKYKMGITVGNARRRWWIAPYPLRTVMKIDLLLVLKLIECQRFNSAKSFSSSTVYAFWKLRVNRRHLNIGRKQNAVHNL